MPDRDTRSPGPQPKHRAPEPVTTTGSGVFDPATNELAARAARGDPQAVNELLEALRPAIVRYCRARIGRWMGTYDAADDAAQDACLGVFAGLSKYQDTTVPVMALAYRIAANKVADHFRKQRTNRAILVDEVPEAESGRGDPQQALLDNELSERLGVLLEVLPDRQREIVILRIVVGLSAGETAQVLETTDRAVRVAQHRALHTLRSTYLATRPRPGQRTDQ